MMSRPQKKKLNRDALKLSDADTIRFLELYQRENVLYDITMEEYRNRDSRAAAANRIADELDIDGFGSAEILTKFKNLRNAYSQELKKIEESRKSGSMEDVYIPRVHWFLTMNSFLRPFIYQRPTLTNLVVSSKTKDTSENPPDSPFLDIKVECLEEMSEPPHDDGITNAPGPSKHPISTHNTIYVNGGKRKGRHVEVPHGCKSNKYNKSNDDHISAAYTRLHEYSQPVTSMGSKQQDMYDHFGIYVASLLRSIGMPRAMQVQQEITNLVLSQITYEYDSPSATATNSPMFGTSENTDIYSPGYSDE